MTKLSHIQPVFGPFAGFSAISVANDSRERRRLLLDKISVDSIMSKVYVTVLAAC